MGPVTSNTAAGRGRVTHGLLVCVVIVGSLALWTVVPVGWMFFASSVVENQGGRFVLVLFGIPSSMALVFVVLSRVDSYRRRLNPASERTPGYARATGHSLLEVMLVVSGAIAVVSLVVWWFLIADGANPSGPLQPI
jgi:hypothetical protein